MQNFISFLMALIIFKNFLWESLHHYQKCPFKRQLSLAGNAQSSVLWELNRSPTSQTCRQNIWSPTSVTNIDVTDNPGQNTNSSLKFISLFETRLKMHIFNLRER